MTSTDLLLSDKELAFAASEPAYAAFVIAAHHQVAQALAAATTQAAPTPMGFASTTGGYL